MSAKEPRQNQNKEISHKQTFRCSRKRQDVAALAFGVRELRESSTNRTNFFFSFSHLKKKIAEKVIFPRNFQRYFLQFKKKIPKKKRKQKKSPKKIASFLRFVFKFLLKFVLRFACAKAKVETKRFREDEEKRPRRFFFR